MKKKLGLIQTGGLGDIHIALPIALFYHKKNFEIYWPIIENWVTQMKHYVPWINWIGISRENKDQAYNEPVKIIEAQIGSILKETDIVRFEDVYGRVKN